MTDRKSVLVIGLDPALIDFSQPGVRANPSNLLLFEKMINVVHKHAPRASLCFNTMPGDTAAAVRRWL